MYRKLEYEGSPGVTKLVFDQSGSSMKKQKKVATVECPELEFRSIKSINLFKVENEQEFKMGSTPEKSVKSYEEIQQAARKIEPFRDLRA